MENVPEQIAQIASDLVKAKHEDDWAMYVAIAQALLAAEKRGREEAAKVVDNIGAEIRNQARNPSETQLGKSIEMVADAILKAETQ